MIKLPKKLKTSFATYEREIAGKSENKAKFYVIAAFITVVLFLIFGIRPLSLTSAQNRKVEKELTLIREGLETKLAKIDESMESIRTHQSKVNILNTRIPKNVQLEEYLKEFVLSAAKSGFLVQRFRQLDMVGNSIPLEVELTGNLELLPELIKSTENLTRYTEVIHVRTSLEDNVTDVRLGLRIYKL